VQVVVAIVVFALLFIVLFVISGPLRSGVIGRRGARGLSPERAELESAREAKYREIRDSELDFRTGKLSAEDYAATDGALRAEAVEILDRLETLEQSDRREALELDDAERDSDAAGASGGRDERAGDQQVGGELARGERARGQEPHRAADDET
jgi:hypothetical protein